MIKAQVLGRLGTWAVLTSLMLSLMVSLAPAQAQVTVYDAARNLVTIPSVSVGAATFTDVKLLNTGNFVFTLQGANEQKPAGPGVGSYDVVSNVLTLPAVKVGEATFLDVKLLNIGSFVFTLQTATALEASVLAEIAAAVAATDALYATGMPASGAARMALADACFLGDGRSKAWLISDTDANLQDFQQRLGFQVGRRTQNLQVLALRQSTNPNGSQRREVDLQFDLRFIDGSVEEGVKTTFVQGSSQGTPGCNTAQVSSSWRPLGNQQLVQAAVRARIYRDQRYSLATGAVLSPAINYRREIQWRVSDSSGIAKYVIVSGQGPASTVNGTSVAFGLKLLSPQVSRSAPEMLGKSGNYVNWKDDDSFLVCRSASSSAPVPQLADCTGAGTNNGADFGWTTSTPNAAADKGFADQGWAAGTVFRFDVYNDDGWKTVNGQAGKTPIATYYDTLVALPYTFVELVGDGGNFEKFPRLNFGNMTPAGLSANALSATPAAVAGMSWTTLPTGADGVRLSLYQGWDFQQGALVGNAGTTFNPALRTLTPVYPTSASSTSLSVPVSAKLPNQLSKTYVEHALLFTTRDFNRQIMTRWSFQ